MSKKHKNEVFVYGVFAATGKQGGATATALLDLGMPVRALVRRPESEAAKRLAERGAQVVRADLDEPDTLAPAMQGLGALWFMTTPFGTDGAAAEIGQGKALADAAIEAGVARIVFSSVGSAERDTGIPHFDSKYQVERELQNLGSGVHVTVIRPVFFMDNLLGMAQKDNDGSIVVRMPMPGDVPLQMIAVDDIGRVSAAVLQDPELVPEGVIEIAADELTGEAVAEVIAEAASVPTRYEALPLESIQDQEEMFTMFRWLAQTDAYAANIEQTREIDPNLKDLSVWISDGQLFRD
ncbi:NmrA/HSCARG family protein [Rothia uropygialis]|uniref:NmrA/HSCARG family protein n=1 Tax=Kocuria sp. 36 TaxID=1415402 RepID=UPI00101CB3DE|nr:NmrA/HSCARG family protein [Kocuria sp. 36]